MSRFELASLLSNIWPTKLGPNLGRYCWLIVAVKCVSNFLHFSKLVPKPKWKIQVQHKGRGVEWRDKCCSEPKLSSEKFPHDLSTVKKLENKTRSWRSLSPHWFQDSKYGTSVESYIEHFLFLAAFVYLAFLATISNFFQIWPLRWPPLCNIVIIWADPPKTPYLRHFSEFATKRVNIDPH